jgi:hypothetical protein
MNRDQLEHVLRAATDIVPGVEIVVIGSQSILAAREAEMLPIEATRSIEVDIAFIDDPDDEMADRLDGAIGELSLFHRTHGYYGQGVSLKTAVLPAGWEDRLIGLEPPRPGARVWALEPHDCIAAKFVAWRPKDLEFAEALVVAGVIDLQTLRKRIRELPEQVTEAQRARMNAWLDRVPPADPPGGIA